MIGGPVLIGGQYDAGRTPLGMFITDALGSPYSNAPAVAGNRASYYNSGTFGFLLWETQVLLGPNAGDPLVWRVGDALYASSNGYLTNRVEDAYQYNVPGQNDPSFVSVMGTVKFVPDPPRNTLLVMDTPY